MQRVLFSAALAQLVEHRIRNARVVGSIPMGGLVFRPLWFVVLEQPGCTGVLYLM